MLLDLFQKTRETSMEMKPQEETGVKVVKCKGCGAENPQSANYCSKCGRRLYDPEPEEPSAAEEPAEAPEEPKDE